MKRRRHPQFLPIASVRLAVTQPDRKLHYISQQTTTSLSQLSGLLLGARPAISALTISVCTSTNATAAHPEGQGAKRLRDTNPKVIVAIWTQKRSTLSTRTVALFLDQINHIGEAADEVL